MITKLKTIFYTLPIPIWAAVLVLSTFTFSSQTVWAGDHSLIPLSDEELSEIYGEGFLFKVDLSLEVLSANSDAPPQVTFNTGTPQMIPTNATSGFSGPGGTVSLSGNAQSNVSSLVNVIGAASVINVGVNVVSITNATNSSIYSTNINTGAQGSGFTVNVPIIP